MEFEEIADLFDRLFPMNDRPARPLRGGAADHAAHTRAVERYATVTEAVIAGDMEGAAYVWHERVHKLHQELGDDEANHRLVGFTVQLCEHGYPPNVDACRVVQDPEELIEAHGTFVPGSYFAPHATSAINWGRRAD